MFFLHLLKFQSLLIKSQAWVRGGRGGGGRRGILISWVTAVALGFLDQTRQRAGRDAVLFYVEGRERFNTTGPSLTAHCGFCIWCLKTVGARSEMMLKAGKEGGAGDENDHTPASQYAT